MVYDEIEIDVLSWAQGAPGEPVNKVAGDGLDLEAGLQHRWPVHFICLCAPSL